jgi:hypothetical protein
MSRLGEALNIESWLDAAERGQVEALYNLGLLYSTGQGVPVDYVMAHKWFNLAAMKGNSQARECRAELALDMSPTEIAEAQRQAREWLLQH